MKQNKRRFPFCENGWMKHGPLCGNSVWNDRQFMAKEMPELLDFLHYRMVDVSTVKELSRRWYRDVPRYPKKEHTSPSMTFWSPLRNSNTSGSMCSLINLDARLDRLGQCPCAWP